MSPNAATFTYPYQYPFGENNSFNINNDTINSTGRRQWRNSWAFFLYQPKPEPTNPKHLTTTQGRGKEGPGNKALTLK